MSGPEREPCAFFEAMRSQRQAAGSSGHRWDRTELPNNLVSPIGKLDRTLHALDGVAHVLRAGFIAQSDGAENSGEVLGDNITDKLLFALSELIERAAGQVELMEEIYPTRSRARVADADE